MTQEEYRQEARRLRPKLLSVARQYLGDDDAEDTVQDALLRLWQMVGELRMPIDALASVLTRNLAVSALRRQRTVALDTATLADAATAADGSTIGNNDRIDRMMAIIESLPPLQQTILRLRHMEGMEMADVAALIGTSEVALRKALSRARQAVRTQYIKKYEQHS